ncbi:hypothetical protein BJ165DRAFT_348158 [Panaeolus papilionaceus]|nr:hypothetical protein BJ165DRAFT_348158 [Panaeolus papilionaceus]
MCTDAFFTFAATVLILCAQHLACASYTGITMGTSTVPSPLLGHLLSGLGEGGGSQSHSLPSASPASQHGVNTVQPCHECQMSCIRNLQETLKTLNAFNDHPYYLRLLFFGEYRRLIKLFDQHVLALEARLEILAHSRVCSHRTKDATDDRSSSTGTTPQQQICDATLHVLSSLLSTYPMVQGQNIPTIRKALHEALTPVEGL